MIRIFASLLILATTIATAEAKSRKKVKLEGQRSGLLTTGAGKSDPDKARFKSAKTFYTGYEVERY
jgi:hypothetical protein